MLRTLDCYYNMIIWNAETQFTLKLRFAVFTVLPHETNVRLRSNCLHRCWHLVAMCHLAYLTNSNMYGVKKLDTIGWVQGTALIRTVSKFHGGEAAEVMVLRQIDYETTVHCHFPFQMNIGQAFPDH